MKRTSTIILLAVVLFVGVALFFIVEKGESKQASPVNGGAKSDNSAGSQAEETSKMKMDGSTEQVAGDSSPNNSTLGKLSKEEEEQLRLNDYQGYLHYKSRIDGKRDRELMGLSAAERQVAIKERLKQKIVEKVGK